jgi:hypothetical protein
VNITAVTNDPTSQIIAARVEAYERKRALPAPDVIEAESREVLLADENKQEGQRRVAREDPTGGG